MIVVNTHICPHDVGRAGWFTGALYFAPFDSSLNKLISMTPATWSSHAECDVRNVNYDEAVSKCNFCEQPRNHFTATDSTLSNDQFAKFRGTSVLDAFARADIVINRAWDDQFVPSNPPTILLSSNVNAAQSLGLPRHDTLWSWTNSPGPATRNRTFSPWSRLSTKLLQHPESIKIVFAFTNLPVKKP